MLFRHRFSYVLFLFIFGWASLPAQEDTTSLRELADANNFFIGAAVYTYHLDTPGHEATLSREFNMLTPENEAKMCEVQPQRNRFDFNRLDELVNFAEANDMVIRGHTLLWHQCMPEWFANGDFSREEAIGIMRDHIMTVVGRYKGRIRYWDVVNEAIDDNSQMRQTPWQQFIGDDYVEIAFAFAHEADPDAILFYNDYGAEGLNAKSDAIYAMVSDLVERDVPIHGVGLQGHFTVGDTRNWVSPTNLGANIDRLGELGLEVQLTEVDFRHDGDASDDILELQARDYYSITHTCLINPHCTAVVTWGVSDQFTWLRNSNLGFFNNPNVEPLLFDEEYDAKPAYYAVADAFREELGLDPVTEFATGNDATETEIAVNIPEPTKSDALQLAPDSVGGAVYYAAFPIAIVLDGNTDDWANIPRVTVTNGPTLPTDNDTVLTFAVAADGDNLYFLAEVQDSQIVYGNYTTSEWYREDSVEFYLNTTGNLEATAYQAGIAQIGIMAANLAQPESLLYGGNNSDQSQVSASVVESSGGYVVEALVPLETGFWSIKPAHMEAIGFQAHLNGSSGTDRDTKLIWSIFDVADQSYNNPSLFGRLVFWDVNE
ncbi:MAG: endo-1,4-beta-xylanase [Anaerolineae bacterium]|nr:endo-1,4-beta-xylanase [Anaerolineae bacterium]